jgi:hypothetical protein
MFDSSVSLGDNIDALCIELADAKTEIKGLNKRIGQLELNAKDNEVLAQERHLELLGLILRARG